MRTYTRCFLDFSEYFTGKIFSYNFCLRQVYNPIRNLSSVKKHLRLELPEFDFERFYDDYWCLIEVFINPTFGYTKKVEHDKVLGIDSENWVVGRSVKMKS